MKNIIYFSHDIKAVYDPKISCMRGTYGLEGYGLFWAIVERMRECESTCFRLPLDAITFGSLETDLRPSFDIREFIGKCIDEYKLFESDGSYFWSVSLCNRMKTKAKISEINKQNAQKKYNPQNVCSDVANESECDLSEFSYEEEANALREHSGNGNFGCEKNLAQCDNSTDLIGDDTNGERMQQDVERHSCDLSANPSDHSATVERNAATAMRLECDHSAMADKDKGKGKDKSLDTTTPLPPPEGEGKVKRSTRPKVQASKMQMGLFERFWAVWPKPVSRGQAEKTWAKLDVTEDLAEKIILGVERAKKYDNRFRDVRYIPHPSTWLNAKGWLDKFGQEDEKNEGSKFGGIDPGIVL